MSESGAIISDDGLYRYALWRTLPDKLGPTPNVRSVLFVMLNPSTADADNDDTTLRRCLGFAESWGFNRLAVGNMYALRATDPRELFTSKHDPLGPENMDWLDELAAGADRIIAAWGATGHPFGPSHYLRVAKLLHKHKRLSCLGLTDQHHPRHPLYVPASTEAMGFDW